LYEGVGSHSYRKDRQHESSKSEEEVEQPRNLFPGFEIISQLSVPFFEVISI
jgi:hypothetical protein